MQSDAATEATVVQGGLEDGLVGVVEGGLEGMLEDESVCELEGKIEGTSEENVVSMSECVLEGLSEAGMKTVALGHNLAVACDELYGWVPPLHHHPLHFNTPPFNTPLSIYPLDIPSRYIFLRIFINPPCHCCIVATTPS